MLFAVTMKSTTIHKQQQQQLQTQVPKQLSTASNTASIDSDVVITSHGEAATVKEPSANQTQECFKKYLPTYKDFFYYKKTKINALFSL